MKHAILFSIVGLLSVWISCGPKPSDPEHAPDDSEQTAEVELQTNDDESDSTRSELAAVTSYLIGSRSKNGSNIATELTVSAKPDSSILTFYRTVRTSGAIKTPVKVADLNGETVELFLTSADYFAINVLGKNQHFTSNVKTFPVKNGIDFKISTAFQEVQGSRYVVGTEDDRNYTARRAPYANVLYNKSYVRKVRFSYESVSGKEGTLKMSSEYTVFSIDTLDCKKQFTGIEENGWGKQYQRCCPKQCK